MDMAREQQPGVGCKSMNRLHMSLSNLNANAALCSLSAGNGCDPKDVPGGMVLRWNSKATERSCFSSRGSESSFGDSRTPSPPLLVQGESDVEWARSPSEWTRSPSLKESAENQGNSAESREKNYFPVARPDAVLAPIVNSQGKLSISDAELLLYQQQQHMLWWWFMYCNTMYNAAAAASVAPPQTPAPLRATPSTPLQEFKINEQQKPRETTSTQLYPAKPNPQQQGCGAFFSVSGKPSSVPRSSPPPAHAELDEDLLLCDESTEDFLSDDTRKREFPCLSEDVDVDEAGAGDFSMELPKKKARRSGQEARVCSNCGTDSTPFWRKGKFDGRPLCNACGLYSSKNDAMRPPMLWKRECSLGMPNNTAPPPPPQQQPQPSVIRPIPSRDSAFRCF